MSRFVRFLILLTLAACIFGGWNYLRFCELRSTLAHQLTVAQMDRIEERARAFLEMKMGRKAVDGGRHIESLSDYGLEIEIPPEHRTEFLEWMRDLPIEPVRVGGWPTKASSSYKSSQETMSYSIRYE